MWATIFTTIILEKYLQFCVECVRALDRRVATIIVDLTCTSSPLLQFPMLTTVYEWP